jgi:hypothetical protein
MPRKIISFDPETYDALILLSRDSMSSVQELADEAFRDLLKKRGRPTSLKDALRKSLKAPGWPKAVKARASKKGHSPGR